jgi:hypothetical protein
MVVLRDVLAKFGFEVDDKKLKDADKKVDGFLDKITTLGRALVGGTAAIGMLAFARDLAAQGAALDDASVRLGIGTDALQALGFAADQSGSSIEAMTTGLLMLQDKVGDALINATGEGAKGFEKYKIKIKDASGAVKSADEIFGDVAEKIFETKDASKQLTIATDLFGRQGRALLPTLKLGREGLAGLGKEFQELGGGFTEDAVKAAAEYDDAMSRFNLTITSLRARIAVALLPTLQKLVDLTTRGVAIFVGLAKHGRIVEVVLGGLAFVLGRLALATLRAFLPVIAGIAAWAALALIVEDIVVLFEGGHSAIGDFIDALFGVGAAAKFVEKVKEVWDGLVLSIKDSIAAIRIFNKLKSGRDLDQNDLAAAGRLGFETGGVARGVHGRSDAEQMIINSIRPGASAGAGITVPAGYTRKQVQAFVEARKANPNAHLGAPTIQQSNVVNVNGVTDPKAVAAEVDKHHRRRNKEAHDALIKHVETDDEESVLGASE